MRKIRIEAEFDGRMDRVHPIFRYYVRESYGSQKEEVEHGVVFAECLDNGFQLVVRENFRDGGRNQWVGNEEFGREERVNGRLLKEARKIAKGIPLSVVESVRKK
jgi:hypothetical protein